jgi:DNA-cytosine methyltransferase
MLDLPFALPDNSEAVVSRLFREEFKKIILEEPTSAQQEIYLLEDNSQCASRRSKPGVNEIEAESKLRLHHVCQYGPTIIGECSLRTSKDSRADIALQLIKEKKLNYDTSTIISTTRYGCDKKFIAGLSKYKFNFAVEIRPSTCVCLQSQEVLRASDLMKQTKAWELVEIAEPTTEERVKYSVANIGITSENYRLFAAQRGGITGINSGTILGISSLVNIGIEDLIKLVGWARWIRPVERRKERKALPSTPSSKGNNYYSLKLRTNIASVLHQEKSGICDEEEELSYKGSLVPEKSQINIAELFAGAGGMGLGFLMANNGQNPYRIVFSGEIHPAYVKTLEQSHKVISGIYGKVKPELVPDLVKPLDLRENTSLEILREINAGKNKVDILIGGPPCQGFSSANRNSGDMANPNNRLVNTFMDYVEDLKPKIALMENVQGIAWARSFNSGRESLLDYMNQRMDKANYTVFHQILDAAEYGVPQFRWRFFALMIHKDLGYQKSDFDEWGPFPKPTHGPKANKDFITVRQAIGDLPEIINGARNNTLPYEVLPELMATNHFLNYVRANSNSQSVCDHITSRHAEYVLERYRAIPEGKNWQYIKDKMTNYANIERTHSNIYRRLSWDEPAITIGHYRKSMLIHPEQHRGLSFREAARLQSFPDWFPFAGGALSNKQQQLANAVCPLLTKAVAELILKL